MSGYFSIILLRSTGFFFTFPYFFGRGVPVAVRGAVSVLIAVFLFQVLPVSHVGIAPLMFLEELIFGISMGLVLHVTLLGAQMAGEVLGFSINPISTMNPTFNQEIGGQENLWGKTCSLLGLAVFFALGGPHAAIGALKGSFQIVPPGQLALKAMPTIEMMKLVGISLFYATVLCLPPLAAALLAQWGLGLVFKVSPAFGLFQFSLPIGSMAALMVMAYFLPSWPTVFEKFWGDALQFLEAWIRFNA